MSASRGVGQNIAGRLGPSGRMLALVCAAIAATQTAWLIVVPVLPAYADEFGATATQLGLVVAVFGVGRLVVNVPTGLLSELVDRRKLLLGAMVGVVVFQLATAFVSGLSALVVLRLATGLAGGMAITAGMALVADLTTASNRGRAMSLLQGIQLAGGSFGVVLGSMAAELWGNRAPFLLCGVLAASVVAFGARPLLRGALPDADETLLVGDAATNRPPVRVLLTDRSYLAVCGVGFAVFFNRFGGTQSLVPIIAYTVVGMSVGQLGLVLGLVTFGTLAMVSLAGILSDRFGRKRIIVPALVVVGLGLPMYALTSSPVAFVAVTIVTGLANGLSGAAPAAYVADVAPARARGTAIGVYRTFGDLAGIAGPIVLGWLVDQADYRIAVLVLAAVTLLSGVVFALAGRETVQRPK